MLILNTCNPRANYPRTMPKPLKHRVNTYKTKRYTAHSIKLRDTA
jgi:hypothetical protein